MIMMSMSFSLGLWLLILINSNEPTTYAYMAQSLSKMSHAIGIKSHQNQPSAYMQANISIPMLLTEEQVQSFKISCILSDVDGTLLPKPHELSKETYEAVRDILEKGYSFFPCTGRTRLSMGHGMGDDFVALFGSDIDHMPGVYQQGLTVYGIGGELIHKHLLDAIVIRLIEDFCDVNNIPLVGYCCKYLYCREKTKQIEDMMDAADPEIIIIPEGLSDARKMIDLQRLLMVADQQVLQYLKPKLEKEFANKVKIVQFSSGLIEITPYGTSKGAGVKILLDYLKIRPDNTMAFGDGENDIEMFSLVKYGVCMENGHRLLKDIALYKTGHVRENGVAKILNYLKAPN